MVKWYIEGMGPLETMRLRLKSAQELSPGAVSIRIRYERSMVTRNANWSLKSHGFYNGLQVW